jgi:hypothetical protein
MSASSLIASHSFTFQLFTACCTAPVSHFMAVKSAHDLPITDKPAGDDAQSDSGVGSATPATSTSPTLVDTKMVDRQVPAMSDFFKKTTVTEEERLAYHRFSWLTDNLLSTIPKLDVSTFHDSTIVCFESYLVAGLGLPPNKFLSFIMNFLGCELVHFNSNAIAALSCFVMLCECWLEIAPDTSLFWYFYSLVRYTKVVYSGIGLSLRRQYINDTFKSSWKDSQKKWFLADMHVQPQWVNKLLFSPFVKDKWGELTMTPLLAALIKQVAKLREAG